MKFGLIGLSTALSLTFSSGAWAQEISLRLHHLLPAGAPAHTKMLVPWAERIEEASDGRVEIEIFPAMTLGGRPPELVSQARNGIAAANLAMREMFDEYLADDYRWLEVMFLHAHAGQAIQTVDADIRMPEDMEGLSMRIPTRTGSWVIEALGAEAISMPLLSREG